MIYEMWCDQCTFLIIAVVFTHTHTHRCSHHDDSALDAAWPQPLIDLWSAAEGDNTVMVMQTHTHTHTHTFPRPYLPANLPFPSP